ncbi:MAG: hypothetical protein ACJ760_13920 [Thermoleophilaceae bacterium]
MAIVAAIPIGTGTDTRGHRHDGSRTVPWQAVLRASPDMGLACPVPNSIACDRVGVALATKRPARAVVVTIGDRSAVLDDQRWGGPRRNGLQTAFGGFLQPAGLRGPGPLEVATEQGDDYYTGVLPVSAPMHITITRSDGSRVRTVVRVDLKPGWG